MSLGIRLTPFGRKRGLTYRIRAAETRRKLTGSFSNELGYFIPRAEGGRGILAVKRRTLVSLINKGAKPSERLASLLKRALRPNGPVLRELDVEDLFDEAAGPERSAPVQLPISHLIGVSSQGQFEVTLQLPGTVRPKGRGEEEIVRALSSRPVAQFAVLPKRRGNHKVVELFTDVADAGSEWPRASFRWRFSTRMELALGAIWDFMKDHVQAPSIELVFESDTDLVERELARKREPIPALDEARLMLGKVRRIYVFADKHEATIEPTESAGTISVSTPKADLGDDLAPLVALIAATAPVASDSRESFKDTFDRLAVFSSRIDATGGTAQANG